MPQPAPPFRAALLAPRHWPAWLGLGLAWLLARLPYTWLYRCGRGLGMLAARLMPARRRVAARNLELCFPQLDARERAALLEANLRDSGLMLVEFALAWLGTARAVGRIPVRFDGLHHLAAARAAGRGVLLVGAHFSHLEMCARLVSQRIAIAGMYREHDDAAFEWAIKRARLRYADAMFTKDELRASVRYLRAGGTLWYAPDQDMRGKDAVFAPFFGVPAATITATHHLARLSGAAVIPFFHRRLDGGGYAIRLEAPLADFPSADAAADTARVNACIERMVREAPSQYLWMHKRFKTRPPGEADVY
ncbi:MAG: LpxL/LpxP family Kdo(2)-lipid IV(A) lauroyl/palmitoleoyl acyltransferase [Rhodanobacteraceae bacterium]|jgi:KDO2-lipid IV(A) lauroyltransferase|nr:LpxL/LpxP family Kdo(2)-lipid IV(A) lauroyl/palmitoleoyl acyltransferase [Rhodanobacteraceae bacterium]